MRREDREDMIGSMEYIKKIIFRIDQFIAANPNNHIMDNHRPIINNIMIGFQDALRGNYVIEGTIDQLNQMTLARNLLDTHYPSSQLKTLQYKKEIIKRLIDLNLQIDKVCQKPYYDSTEYIKKEFYIYEYAVREEIIHLSATNSLFQWEVDYLNARIDYVQGLLDNPNLILSDFNYHQDALDATALETTQQQTETHPVSNVNTQEPILVSPQQQIDPDTTITHSHFVAVTHARQPSFIHNLFAPIREFFGNIFNHRRVHTTEEDNQDSDHTINLLTHGQDQAHATMLMHNINHGHAAILMHDMEHGPDLGHAPIAGALGGDCG